MAQQMLSIKKVGELLGVCENTLREWDKVGKLKSIRTPGNHRRWFLKDVEKLLQQNTPEGDN